MFSKKKHTENYDDEKPERKKSNRPIFGFRCSPVVYASAKELALKLHVDLGVIAEHALQIGLMDVESAMKDPQETEFLREHLNEAHAIKHLVYSLSKYDEEAAGYIRDGQLRRYHKERAVRDLVDLWTRAGLDPREMRAVILYHLKRMTDVMQARAAQK